jgi:hypothetical protein
MKIISNYQRLALATITGLLNLAVVCHSEDMREEFHKTYPLDKAGRFRLDNVNGNVQITGWDREEVKLDAIKRAKTQEQLEQVQIEVDPRPGDVRVKTKYPDSQKGKNNSASVDYTITVPKGARLDKINTVNGTVQIQSVSGDIVASSVNGTVAAKGLASAVQLSTVNGSVKASSDVVNKDIKLNSVNGSVTLALPAGVNAEVSADTLNGGIHCDFPLETKTHFPVGRKLQGKLGEGGPEIKLSSVNGGIRIEQSASGKAERE